MAEDKLAFLQSSLESINENYWMKQRMADLFKIIYIQKMKPKRYTKIIRFPSFLVQLYIEARRSLISVTEKNVSVG